jgi:hypothetical protein
MKTAGIRAICRSLVVLCGLAAAGLLAPAARAFGEGDPLILPLAQPDHGDAGPAWDEAQSQEGAGPALSLKDARRIVRSQFDGKIVDTQLFQYGGGWIYRVRVRTNDGRVVDVGVDGQTGQIVDVQG